MDHLQPLSEFIKHHVKGDWEAGDEYIVYKSPTCRFRIVVESPVSKSIEDGFRSIARDEALYEKNIDPSCDDAKEFSQSLIDGVFQHLSPHETMHLIAALEADIDKWHKERSEAFAKEPKFFSAPPTEADKRCTR